MEPEGTVITCTNCGKQIFVVLKQGGFGEIACPDCGMSLLVLQPKAARNLAEALSNSSRDQFTAADYNNRGNILDAQGRYDEAIENFNRAIELDSTYALAYYNRGNVYARHLQLFDKALDDYSQAINLNPTYALAYNNRGGICANMERFDEALEDLKKALQLDPDLAGAHFGIGMVHSMRKEWQKALPFLEKARDLGNPEAAEVLTWARREREKEKQFWLDQTKSIVSINCVAYSHPEGRLQMDEVANTAKALSDQDFAINNFTMYEKLILGQSKKNILWIPGHIAETRFDIYYITHLIRHFQHKITLAPLENPFRMDATIADVRDMLYRGDDPHLDQVLRNIEAGFMPLISRQGEARYETKEFIEAAKTTDIIVIKGLRNFSIFWEASSAQLTIDTFYMFVCHNSDLSFVSSNIKSHVVGIDEGMVLAYVPANTPISGTLASFSKSY